MKGPEVKILTLVLRRTRLPLFMTVISFRGDTIYPGRAWPVQDSRCRGAGLAANLAAYPVATRTTTAK